jgi:translation initiation factor 2B subunit (eIF-2B alpha/beta/delta family)
MTADRTLTEQIRIDQLTDDIAANRVPGGSAFARAAAELITLRAGTLPESSSIDDVRRTVTEVSRWVADTKPSMAVVRNVADLAQTVSAEVPVADAAGLKAALGRALGAYIENSVRAIAALGDFARDLFHAGDTVLIHSYSASLEALLRSATADGTRFRLLVTESRPYRESRRLVEAIADSATEIVLYSDAAVCVAAEAADWALVGADSVFTDGSFANKTGSKPIALACRECETPLYVATELSKLYFGDSDDIAMEQRPAAELAEGWPLIESGRVGVRNQFFERVDANLVHRYITEEGLLTPQQMHPAAARSWKLLLRSGDGRVDQPV